MLTIQHSFVLYDVIFTPGGKRYSYLAEEDYAVGDFVVVPVGQTGREAVVQIVERRTNQDENGVQLKKILRRANEAEVASFGKVTSHKPKKTKEQKYTGDTPKNSSIYEGFQEDGSFVFSYEDYGVDFYDGADVEVIYKLDAENAEKLRMFLGKKYVGGLEYMLVQECGSDYRKKAPTELFDEAGVKYESFTWIS